MRHPGIRVRHLLRHHCLPAAARLRACLRMSVLALLAMCAMLVPHWPAQALPATAATLTAGMPAGGEEVPPGETTGQETPAKLRRVAGVQAPHTAANRPAPPQTAATLAMPVPVPSFTAPAATLPAAHSPPPTPPVRWRLQRSQAPPLA